ncbi:MAG: T9SS type A sorting domain-containing protein [Ignavibacteriales bacterium]|nr:T9SS type A sorting domain-containing protein [Ignavibacteriales bacterium]
MKKNIILFVIIFLSLFTVIVNAQSIWFLNPTNGEILTGTGSQTTVYMQLNFNYNLSGDPNLYDHYIKLFRSPYSTQQSGQGGGITFDYDLPIGTYTWRLELWECYVGQGCTKEAEQTVTFYVKHKISVSNNFGGGNVKIDGATVGSGSQAYKFTGNNLLVGAIDQNYAGYDRLWNQSGYYNSNWTKRLWGESYQPINGGTPRDFNYSVVSSDNGADIQGQLRKRLTNITFQNNFVAVGNGGVIKVNSVQYNSPKSGVQVVEQNPVTGTAVTQTINGIQYSIDHWSDASTSSSRTFYPPSDNLIYTAYYKGKPLSYTVMNTHFNDVPGQNVIIYWNDHPNTNVTQYQIWRKVKHNGVTGPPTLIATINRGTTTYTDYDYEITNGYTDDLLRYDVRPYYSTESVYADPYWLSIFGELVPKTSDSTSTSENIPEEFSLSCYPNPFNPSTNIRVTMPSDGLLQAAIYNVLGEEILTLKNEFVTKGNYNIIWDGKDEGSNQVNSGIYIVMVKTEDKIISQKIVLLK